MKLFTVKPTNPGMTSAINLLGFSHVISPYRNLGHRLLLVQLNCEFEIFDLRLFVDVGELCKCSIHEIVQSFTVFLAYKKGRSLSNFIQENNRHMEKSNYFPIFRAKVF